MDEHKELIETLELTFPQTIPSQDDVTLKDIDRTRGSGQVIDHITNLTKDTLYEAAVLLSLLVKRYPNILYTNRVLSLRDVHVKQGRQAAIRCVKEYLDNV